MDRNCERLLNAMKEAFSDDRGIYITTMKTKNTCNVNNLPLGEDDIYIAEHLTTGHMMKDGETYKFIRPLAAGDLVLLVKLNDEKYAIVERLVQA